MSVVLLKSMILEYGQRFFPFLSFSLTLSLSRRFALKDRDFFPFLSLSNSLFFKKVCFEVKAMKECGQKGDFDST